MQILLELDVKRINNVGCCSLAHSRRMRVRESGLLNGVKCLLVPYTKNLVEQYHSWFVKDPQLLELTCSELLSLDEEYVNQVSWTEDPNKLTFLIRDKTLLDHPLCGDINCFFSDFFEQDWNESVDVSENPTPQGKVGEINLMIAEKNSRRKGIAEEALSILTRYIEENVSNVKILVAKIQIDNFASIQLFQKAGFAEFKRVECFQEVHYCKFLD